MIRLFAVSVSMGAVLLGMQLSAQEGLPTKSAPAPLGLKTFKQQSSYGMGLDIGGNLRLNEVDLDLDALVLGIKDALSNSKARLSQEELQKVMTELSTQISTKADVRFKALAVKNKKEGTDFLASNRTKPGIKVLDSGVQYKVLKTGKGVTPRETDVIKAHYHGTLIDGTVFDSSVDRKPSEPLEFTMNDVIPGWAEALKKMKVGDKWQIFVPTELAYEMEPPPNSVIGPNVMLIFEIELLDAAPPSKTVPAATSRKQ